MKKIGVLITNTGTPSAPTPKALRRYLCEFLSDKRIVQLPRFLWLPILYGLVLPFRSRRSAKLYQQIWTEMGSPMRVAMQNLTRNLQALFHGKENQEVSIALGMNYGHPSIPEAISQLLKEGVEEVLVLPLFPQYSHTTTASSFDRVKKTGFPPQKTTLIEGYYHHPHYIAALARTIQLFWQKSATQNHLLISFHGIPKRYVESGDPYESHCQKTAQLLAEALALDSTQWTLCYQSKFGYDKWLSPSTQQLFMDLPKQGVKQLDIICPGFSVDCLETMEEIAITGKEMFTGAGGQSLRYLPALNDSHSQVELLAQLITEHMA